MAGAGSPVQAARTIRLVGGASVCSATHLTDRPPLVALASGATSLPSKLRAPSATGRRRGPSTTPPSNPPPSMGTRAAAPISMQELPMASCDVGVKELMRTPSADPSLKKAPLTIGASVVPCRIGEPCPPSGVSVGNKSMMQAQGANPSPTFPSMETASVDPTRTAKQCTPSAVRRVGIEATSISPPSDMSHANPSTASAPTPTGKPRRSSAVGGGRVSTMTPPSNVPHSVHSRTGEPSPPSNTTKLLDASSCTGGEKRGASAGTTAKVCTPSTTVRPRHSSGRVSKQMVPAQACVLHAPVQPKSGGVAQDDWLMQKAIEVSMLCRSKIKNASDLEERRVVVERLALFMEEIKQVSVTLGIERDGIFQCLIQMHSGGVSFDSQAGSRDVPMHQAKVLDRSERIASVEAEVKQFCGDRVHSLVVCANDLRQLLRVKVEDDNDILMAENTVAELLEFYKRLYASAEKQGEAPYAIYKLVSVF